jgi:hypothetical protein
MVTAKRRLIFIKDVSADKLPFLEDTDILPMEVPETQKSRV